MNQFRLTKVSGWKKMRRIFITQKKIATNDFEKDFYRLLNNAFYGKTVENVSSSKRNSDHKAIGLLTYKNHYVPIKTLDVFLGENDSESIFRRCLSPPSSQNVLTKH